MRRDMEIVRELLLNIADGVELLEYDPDDKQEKLYIYHVEILKQAGFIKYDKFFQDMVPKVYVDNPRLTWSGNDYLESISNKNVWSKTKELIYSKGLGLADVPYEVIKDVSTQVIKTKIGI